MNDQKQPGWENIVHTLGPGDTEAVGSVTDILGAPVKAITFRGRNRRTRVDVFEHGCAIHDRELRDRATRTIWQTSIGYSVKDALVFQHVLSYVLTEFNADEISVAIKELIHPRAAVEAEGR